MMKHLQPKSIYRSLSRPSEGYTLVEVLLIVALLGILTTLSALAVVSFQRRERLNLLALEMAGWIENVRNQAANEVRESDAEGGCAISFENSVNGGYNQLIGSVDPVLCENLAYPQLRIPFAADVDYTMLSNGSGQTQVVRFTPRGMILTNPALQAGFEYRFALADGRGPKRCVRISDITGTVDIGYGSDDDLSSACSRYSGI